MGGDSYMRILYPDAAESLGSFGNYKVFLRHWDILSDTLRNNFEIVKTRKETKIIALHGSQGVGKTMFANRLIADLEDSAKSLQDSVLSMNDNNLWHRISGGAPMSKVLIEEATKISVVKKVEDNENWIKKIGEFTQSQINRVSIVVADNAERSYFCQGLLGISMSEYVQLQDNERFMTIVAQKLVANCREAIRGSLLLILSNDMPFLESLMLAVDKQHRGLMTLLPFPEPNPVDRETIVRVNTNRLNSFSYWYCIDRAGPYEKSEVYKSLKNAASFRDAFRSIDNALNSFTTRPGRPANKNLITLVVMHPETDAPDWLDRYADLDRTEYQSDWVRSNIYKARWAELSVDNTRECGLLESEWQLRIVVLGNQFVRALLSPHYATKSYARELINKLQIVYSPVTAAATRRKHKTNIDNIISKWPDVSSVDTDGFWSAGQSRSGIYESALKQLFSAYDKGGRGFIDCRPDLIIERYEACRVLSAAAEDSNSITQAIKRTAHVMEFTAIQKLTKEAVSIYLRSKLPNYIKTTQEQ